MEVFEKLRFIQEMCKSHYHGCNDCIYATKMFGCRIKDVVYELCTKSIPARWDLEYVKERLDGTD